MGKMVQIQTQQILQTSEVIAPKHCITCKYWGAANKRWSKTESSWIAKCANYLASGKRTTLDMDPACRSYRAFTQKESPHIHISTKEG